MDTEAHTKQVSQINAANAEQSKRLAKRMAYSLRYAEDVANISLLAPEIDGLTALLHRAVPAANAKVKLTQNAAMLNGTYQLPKPFKRFYINISSVLLSSNSGIELTELNIGDISIAGDTALWLMSKAADLYAGKGTADKVLASIQKIDISPRVVTANIIFK